MDRQLADIVSDSWFLGTEAETTPDIVTAFQQVFEQANGLPIGFANPAIYARYGTSVYHDVTGVGTPTRSYLNSYRAR